MIFSALSQPVIDDILTFRDRLRVLHLTDTPNTPLDYNAFIDQYDVFN